MGRKENPLVNYYNDARHFAELMNGWLFHGRKYLRSEDVSDEDRRLLARSAKRQYRDIFKRVRGVRIHLLIGMELQEHVHYAMPLKVMDYDTIVYNQQKSRISSRHREAEDLKEDEYLCGFAKTDRLCPVVTLVLYCGLNKEWDGAESLHELLDMKSVPDYVADYPIHVLDICHAPDARLKEFPLDICFMFQVMKNMYRPEKMMKFLEELPDGEVIEEETFEAIADYMDSPRIKEWSEKVWQGGNYNMRNAFDEILEAERQKGIATGVEAGIEQFSRLTSILLDAGRYEDLKRVSTDKEYRKKLLYEYKPSEHD